VTHFASLGVPLDAPDGQWTEAEVWPTNKNKLDIYCSPHARTRPCVYTVYKRPLRVVWLRVEHWAHWKPRLVVAEWLVISNRQQQY